MIALAYNAADWSIDLVRDGNVGVDEGLETAVLLSLFTDRRASDDDGVPVAERRGWWGDGFADVEGDLVGSRMWLLARVPESERPARAREFGEEALAWLVEDGIAASAAVTAEEGGPGVLRVGVEIVKPQAVAPRFKRVWEVHFNAV